LSAQVNSGLVSGSIQSTSTTSGRRSAGAARADDPHLAPQAGTTANTIIAYRPSSSTINICLASIVTPL
jgi:hypothetical protein